MKRFLTIFLTLTCVMAVFCPTFAVVECRVPQDLPGVLEEVAVHDVLIIGGTPEDNTATDSPVLDLPADGASMGQTVDGKYATMGDLYQAWGGYEGYPAYICGVWSTDGGMSNMTVAVTKDKAGERGKVEILSLLENPDSVTFTYQSYSYQELQEVNEAIVERMIAGDQSIVACGIYEMENKVHISVLETAEDAEETAQNLVKTYGDKVTVELGAMLFDTTTIEETYDRGVPGVLLVLAVAVVLIGITVAVKLPARLTSAGKVITERPMSRCQVEKLVAESTEIPSERVEEQIKKRL